MLLTYSVDMAVAAWDRAKIATVSSKTSVVENSKQLISNSNVLQTLFRDSWAGPWY